VLRTRQLVVDPGRDLDNPDGAADVGRPCQSILQSRLVRGGIPLHENKLERVGMRPKLAKEYVHEHLDPVQEVPPVIVVPPADDDTDHD